MVLFLNFLILCGSLNKFSVFFRVMVFIDCFFFICVKCGLFVLLVVLICIIGLKCLIFIDMGFLVLGFFFRICLFILCLVLVVSVVFIEGWKFL